MIKGFNGGILGWKRYLDNSSLIDFKYTVYNKLCVCINYV